MEEGKDEENNNEVSNIPWWGSWPTWLQAAKEKSSNALEFMKRDLSEFSHVVQTDAVAAVSSTAAILKEKLNVETAEAVAGKARQSITSVLETITDVFAPQKELEDAELMIIENSEPVAMDWWQSQLYKIRKDPKTFCHEPEGPPEMYESWLESFDCEDHQEEMTKIMMTFSDVQTLYDRLVPTSVSHLEFWQRYFYRVYLLRKAEAKRADLMRRAEQISIHDVEWDEDEESSSTRKQNTTTNGLKSVNKEIIRNSSTNHLLPETVTTGPAQIIPDTAFEKKCNATKTVTDKRQEADHDISSLNTAEKNANKVLSADSNTDIQTEFSSTDSSEGSRLSPVESLGKDYSTGDEWEKDFDLESNESDLQKQCVHPELQKEEDDDWEKWQ